MIADSHAHLDMPQFDADRPEVIQRAREAGVELLLTIGSANPQESSVEKALALAQEKLGTRHPTVGGIFATLARLYVATGDKEKAMAAGCDDFDTKPVDMPRLLEKIRALMPSAPPLRRPAGAFGRRSIRALR